jgi:glycosyltransferase 2 family protein
MRQLIGLCVSLTLLVSLYAVVDVRALMEAVRSADPWWLISGLALLVPLTLATAWRFSLLVRDVKISLGESNRLILASSTLNLFLPSKLGDLAKAIVLTDRHGVSVSLALSITILEKALDTFSLLTWGAVAILYVGVSDPVLLVLTVPLAGLLVLVAMLIFPFRISKRTITLACRAMPRRLAMRVAHFSRSLSDVVEWFWSRPVWACGVLGMSLGLWFIHLWQFWFFTRSVGVTVPVVDNMAFATLSILIGLLPFTLAGIGSRDAAIVFFYSAYLSPAAAAFVGILATLRYVVPAIAGLPFVGDFSAAMSAKRRPHGSERAGS